MENTFWLKTIFFCKGWWLVHIIFNTIIIIQIGSYVQLHAYAIIVHKKFPAWASKNAESFGIYLKVWITIAMHAKMSCTRNEFNEAE